MSRDHNLTLRHKKTSRFTFGEKSNLFSLGLLAGNIANYAICSEHIFDPITSISFASNPNLSVIIGEAEKARSCDILLFLCSSLDRHKERGG